MTADDCMRALARGAERAAVNGSDPLGWVPRGSARVSTGSPGSPAPRVAPPREIGGEMGVRFAPPAVPESGVLAARRGAAPAWGSFRFGFASASGAEVGDAACWLVGWARRTSEGGD